MSEFSLAKVLKLLEKANSQGISISFSEGELSVHVEKGKKIEKTFLEELRDNKPFLIQYFKTHAAREKNAGLTNPLQPFDRGQLQKIPLSFSQDRLWFIDQLEGSVQYHVPTVLRLTGKINTDALSFALQNCINRHEILRTVIREEEGAGFQHINGPDRFSINFIDGSIYQDPQALQTFIQALIRKPFDLSKDHMLRADLINIGEDVNILVVTMHHIASDAWSSSILVKEVVEAYSAFTGNRQPDLPPMPIQFADYAVWQRNYLQGSVLENKINYWKQKLDGSTPIQLPTDFSRPPVQSSKGAHIVFTVDKELAAQLKKLSQQQGTTLYMTLLSTFKVLLYRYSGQQDICVGTSIASREQQALEGLIGFFVNTLVLRDEVNGESRFIDLLQQVKITTLKAYEHQDVPFEKVVEAVVKERDPSRNPLFQVMLVLANTPEVSAIRLGELQLSKELYEANISKFDLTFFVNEMPDGLSIKVEYSTDLFSADTIKKMTEHFAILLGSVVKDPQQKLGLLPMLAKKEEQQILEKFNDSLVTYPKDKTIVDLFEEQVAKNADQPALVFEGTTLSYRQLNERSNQLAHHLKSRGVKPGSLVPLYVERSMAMIVGIMGIMKAGAAYVPIDTDFPAARISYMLENTNAKIIVSSSTCSGNLEVETNVSIIDIDELNKDLPIGDLEIKPVPSGLAYVIYTSGSTGKPKGVMIEHRNLADYYYGLNKHTQIDQCRSFALVSTIATDLGNTVIYASLLSGGALHLFTKESVSNIGALHHYFAVHQIDCLKIVPSHWKALSSEESLLLPNKLLVFGGEALQSEMAESIGGSSCTVVNHYGPTETTIGKLLHLVEQGRSYGKTIPIGKPFSNTRTYILSKELQPCPVGVPGQLYIAGDGLARGYYNNEILTKEKFIKNPFNEGLMYGTGDLVKYLPDGNILFIGRVDDQVKIRGYRIELGEIESMLLQSDLVSEAVVLAREDKQNNRRLVAYIVPAEQFDKEELITFLKQELPDYMIPAVFVELVSMPLTANGKIDRKSLPDPDAEELLSSGYLAPRNETEAKLAAIWEDVLEVEQVGVHNDFFELGGHSLLAVRLISAIRKAFVVEMPIGDIFDYPTVALLAQQVLKQTGTVVLPPIQAVHPRPQRIPLSFSQERLWFIDQMEGSVQYHVPAILRLKGKLNKDALAYALQQIINRHEILRTVICEEDGRGYQYIRDKDAWRLNSINNANDSQQPEAIPQLIRHLVNKPFDLAKDHMLRADLVRLDDNEHILIVTLHHIASDGWSASIIVKELVEFWKVFEEGREATLEKLSLQYADFAIWQRNYLQGEVLEKKLAFWKENLKGVEPLQLPVDYVRPAVQSTRGAFARFALDKNVAEGLQKFSKQEGTSLFMTLLATFNVLLYRYSGQQDICVGTPIAGRQQAELENLIGFFVNTLALRNKLNDTTSFTDFLQQVRANTLNAYEHQELPFEKVVEAVVKEREMSRSPVFQVMFILQNTPRAEDLHLSGLQLLREPNEHDTTKFEMTFSMAETGNGMNGAVEYCPDLYSEQTINKMIVHFKALLKAVIETPQQTIGMLPMLTPAETQQLIFTFNDTKVVYPRDKSITDLFTEQAIRKPDGVAVVFEEERLTYRELDERSNQLAHYLKSKEVKENTLVPICIERSIEMVIGVVAILKAGAAYVPVDPDYPRERIIYMISDVNAGLIITSRASRKNIPAKDNVVIIEMDGDWEEIKKQPKDKPLNQYQPQHLAYMLYTSGSTGKPKGVKMPGGALVNLLSWQEKQFVNKNRRVLQFASLNFDVSFQEIFSTICFGSTLYLINAERRKDVAELIKDLVNHRITHLFVPYIVLKNLADNVISLPRNSFWLEEVIVAGEQLKLTDDIQLMLQENIGKIINQYGPTEAHVVSSYIVDTNKELPPLPPIGKPIDNTRLYISGNSMQLVPVGVAGELYIGGVQVAEGYLGQPQQTAEKFITDIFSSEPGARLYKTGDLARWTQDGNIEYLGRIDDQVKIRGFRIELGEVESLLQECDLVRQAVVMAKNDANGNKRLVSYIVPEGPYQKEEIVAYAKSRLPDYMIPSLWMQMDKLPVTGNGKIDKKSLPDPDASDLIGNAFVAPRDKLEQSLAEIWMKLLGIEKVGINDNFFELGGHSLLATRIVAAIRKQLEIEIAIKDLFLYPTIAGLALRTASQAKNLLQPSIQVQQRPALIPLSFSQERLWFFDQVEGTLPYHLPTVLRLKGDLDKEALFYALREIVNRHEVLRTVIKEVDGEGFQFIKERDGWQLNFIDGSVYKDDKVALQKYLQQLTGKPFDLSKDDMIRAHLIGITGQDHILVVTMHHIAADGWSISVLVNEVAAFYNAYTEGIKPDLAPLPIQYADYSIWQRSYLQGETLHKKIGYWKDKLRNVPALDLPVNYSRPAVQSTRGAVTSFSIDKNVCDQLNAISRQEGTTMFMTLLATLNVLIYRYSGQDDICIGTPIAGRQQQELESLIGFFINTLALRNHPGNDMSFSTLLQQVKTTTLDAYEHQEVPFEKVVESVVKERDFSRSPLFQVMFIFQNTPDVPALRLGAVELSREPAAHHTTKFELTFTITEHAQGLQGSVEYCTDLFNEQTIHRMTGHFKALIQAIVAAPTQMINALPMLNEVEQHQLLSDFNDTKLAYPNKSLIDFFEAQVVNTPSNVAVVFEDKELTYHELNCKVNQFARLLQSKGVTKETIVPIYIERSIEMVIGLLGILKAGAAYVPIDPDYPADRISYMLEDIGTSMVVTSRQSSAKIRSVADLMIIAVDDDSAALKDNKEDNLETAIFSNQLAYVIYTSGSTGKPKGVMIEHGSVANLLQSIAAIVEFKPGDSFLSVTTYSFDIAYLELYLPLLFGGRLIIASREVSMNGFILAEKIEAYRPTHMQATPSTWQVLLDCEWENNEGTKMLIGGEAVKEEIKDALTQRGDVYNCYGPTETTIWSVIKKLERNKKVVIGKPLSNTNIAILNNNNQLCPLGVAGEICIGGAGLARGYFKRPELTAEKFIDDPYSTKEGVKLYRTGDLGRWLADGNIECLGRLDDQVKVRGFRIELGEIETVLEQSALVEQAVVLAKEDKQSNKRLVGYIISKGPFNKEALIDHVKSKLPAYMVPALWVQMESFPLTPNGKINRKALPDPDISGLLVNNYTPPATETEEVLAEIWQDLLGVERVGTNDNFFELGGHSLLIIKMVAMIRKRLSFTIPVLLLFQFTTIKDISKYLDWEHDSKKEEEDTTAFEVLSI